MMLTRFVRIQLTIFTILGVVSMVLVAVDYVHVPHMLGLGRYTVTLQLPRSGGLYPHGNVAYRGITVGTVSSVGLDDEGVAAKLSLDSGVQIPTSAKAYVHSTSAIGEQYVDLVPASSEGPYLSDGDTISEPASFLPQRVGPLLDKAEAMLAAVPQDRLREVIDESFRAFNGSAQDMSRLLDSTITFVDQADGAADQSKTLIEQLGPLLDDQNVTSSEIRGWVSNLANITAQVQGADPQLRHVIETGPDLAAKAQNLFDGLRPTLPILLKNLTSVGQVLVTYNPALEQVLLLLPPLEAAQTTVVQNGQQDGAAWVDFAVGMNDPPACTTGYLPASQRRGPTEMGAPPTPSDLYCKVPHGSPFAVRGSRNLPCLNNPGHRAATPEECGGRAPYKPEGDNGWADTDVRKGPPLPLPQINIGAQQYSTSTGAYIGKDGNTYSVGGVRTGSGPGGGAAKAPSWQSLLTPG